MTPLTRKRPEVVVGEVAKSRTDAWRVSVRSHREGRLVTIAQVHRFAGGEVDVPGKGLSVRPDQVADLAAALTKAAGLALSERAAADLQWLDSKGADDGRCD